MLLPHNKWNGIFLLLLVGIPHLIRTNAYLPRLPVHSAVRTTTTTTTTTITSFSQKEIFHKKQERIASFSSVRATNGLAKLSAATTDDDSGGDPATLLGALVLLTVPLSWGTYVPVVRYLYKIEPPVPGFVFSACYYTLAAATTLFLASRSQPDSIGDLENRNDDFSVESVIPFKGGIELGLYLFVANCLQVIGLQTVESDRAGFLVQLTTVMVPVCEGIFAGSLLLVPARTWAACIMAFSGLCIMGLDGKSDLVWNDRSLLDAVFSFSQGDFLILGAAVLYTLHVVRLGTYARQTTPIKLAASKAATESILSFALIFFLVGLSFVQDTAELQDSETNGLLSFSLSTGHEITSFFSSFTAGISDGSISTTVLLPAFGAILWTGWITCAYTIWAQSFGQSKVSPTSANLIYTFQPIFTALFAYFLLGEKMGSIGFLGGSIIAIAVYIVASSEGGSLESTKE